MKFGLIEATAALGELNSLERSDFENDSTANINNTDPTRLCKPDYSELPFFPKHELQNLKKTRERPSLTRGPCLDSDSPRIIANMSIIEIENLKKSYRVYQKQEGVLASIRGLFHREYREVEAVRGVNLRVEQGEFVAFLGPNGAGKTTTLKLLSGVINPSSGTATVMGHVPWKREDAYRRRFALVMGQKNQLWWDLPAIDSFRLHQHIYNLPTSEFERTRDELTEMLDVRQLLGQPVRELSLGERMKMELIAALLHSPEVLFLDEPTIGLDVVAQHRIQQFLKNYQRERRTTVLLTSHYMKDIAALCKRVVVIAQGQIRYDGSLSGIIDQFSGDKIVTLQLDERTDFQTLQKPPGLVEIEPPRIRFRIARDEVARVLGDVLDCYQVTDVIVEDPPLEEVIASMFREASQPETEYSASGNGRRG